MKTKNWIRQALIGTAMLAMAGCSGNDLTKSASPVALIATTSQTLHTLDLLSGATGCNVSIGTVSMQALIKNPSSGTTNTTFEQVHVTSYQVSYVRTDGGKLVPAPFVMSTDLLLTPGGGASATTFLAFQADALTQAPFAALLPVNGGRDPDTGQAFVSMDVTLTFFGETLAGDKVSAQTKVPLTFCFNCGGCS
jgi:hypothetical protein